MYEPRAPNRRSHASEISSPPPSAWPSTWAMKTFGIRAIDASTSWPRSIIAMLAAVSLAMNALMSAPAEKNFFEALRTITTFTPSSAAAASTAAPSSSMKSLS